MSRIKDTLNNEAFRAYVYRVLLALGSAAVFYGIATQEEIVMWTGILATVFNIMPAANTSTKPEV